MIRIRSRKSWKALPPKNPRTRVSWNGVSVYVHHSVTKRPYGESRHELILSEKAAMRTLQQIAFSRGFSDVSYSYAIMPSGRVYAGRGARVLGAHTLGHNSAIGVVLVGDYSIIRPTKQQERSLGRLTRRLHAKYGAHQNLIAHRDVYATSCPGNAAVSALKL